MPSPLMLFAGGRAGDFIANGTISEQGAGAGTFDTSWADCSVNLNANVTVTMPFTDATGAGVAIGSGSSVSVHAYMGFSRGLVAGALLTLYNAAGQPWLRINCPSNGTAQLQYNSNTGASPTWTNLGSAATSPQTDYDITLTIAASGPHTVLFAIGGTAIYSGTFTNANLTATSLTYFTIFNTDPGGTLYLSQCMASRDMGLVGAKLKTLRPTGAGTYTQWTGAYTDVNEVVTSDANYNVTTATGQKQSFNVTDVTVPANYSIASVFVKMRVRNDGGQSAAQNIQALARSGGADYTSGNLPGVVGAYSSTGTRYDTDPATGVAWTQSGVNALELGYASAA